MRREPNMRPALLVIAALAAFKVGLFVAFGPYFIDNDHAGIARQILDGPWDWLRQRSLAENGWSQLDAWRPLGYGALLALCELIAGAHWVGLAIAVQVLVHAAVSAVMFRAAHVFTGRTWLALLALVAYDTGEALPMGLAVYPDGLFSDLFAAGFLTIVARMQQGRAPTIPVLLASGAAMALALTLKEAAMPFAVMSAGVAAIWSRRCGRGWIASALAGALVIGPVVVTGGVVSAWNYSRTGHAFLTVGARTAMAVPLAGMAAMGVPVFDRDDPMDRLARAALAEVSIPPGARTLDMVGQTHVMARINYGLWECCRLDGFAINDAVSRRYRETVLNHPLGVLNLMTTANHWHVLGFFRPTKSVAALYDVNNGTSFNGPRPVLGAALATHDPVMIAIATLHGFDVAVSLVLFVGFFVLFPARLLGLYRRGPIGLWPLWLAHVSMIAFYSAIWLEHRYLMPTMPGAEIVALAMLAPLLQRQRR